MIGIDITRISRFEHPKILENILKKFNVDGDTPIAAAKTWACIEALIKAKGEPFKVNNFKILFPEKSAPQIHDPDNVLGGKYFLSLSHEGNMLVAVAVRNLHEI